MTALDWKYAVLDVPDGGLAVSRAATPAERVPLATALDILAVDHAQLDGRIRSAGEGRYRLDGTLTADVSQACVVTLDPVPARLAIKLAIDFLPQALLPPPIPTSPDEADADEEARLAEPIVNGVMDLGEVVFQEIAAALDPYPRLPDAALDQTEAGPKDDGGTNPFAKLRNLKLPSDKT
ncbi:MAG: YceD family protein [Hyphomicrobiaceae bacterium]